MQRRASLRATSSKGASLTKADFEKAIADAVAPLQKALDESVERVRKLEAQPAAPKVFLKAVAKGEDLGSQDAPEIDVKPIVDAGGESHAAAGFIKALHSHGGQPLSRPLNK
jgi:hypothetical protein